jgi:hypothetical protein
MRKKGTKNVAFPEPQMIEGSVSGKSIEIAASSRGEVGSVDRRNRASTISRTDKYGHIEGGVIPFTYGGGNGKYTSNISIKDAIILCQKAYYNFSIFRNTIDLMTEFSCSPIYFTGGNAQSLKFFNAWAERVNLWKLQDMFFREFYRSGNVFLYKLNASFSKADMMVINEILAATKQEVPIRYIVLNPADIQSIGSASFVTPRYVKILNDFETQILTNPQTPEDKELAKRVEEFSQLQKSSKLSQANQYLVFFLDPDRVKTVFYKKQDYEPFSVPMGFPVLQDLNWKQELKSIDMAISRTVQQAVLLVTMGNDEIGMPSKEQIENLTKIFQNESVGRILVTDYTTSVKFVIPDIGQILDPKKYEVVDRDIRYGLNNVLVGDESYSNTSTKIEVFLSRLKHSRETFLNQFLIPEIKDISKKLGFKNVPTPRFVDADFKNDSNLSRIYSRLIEIGVLTPEEGLTAIDTGRLPLPQESLDNQRKLSQYHKDGLYQPLLNNPNLIVQPDGAAPQKPAQKPAGSKGLVGRPPGTTGISKTGGKVGKIGASEYKINANKVAENLAKFDKLVASIEDTLKDKFKKKRLSDEQKKIVCEIAETIGTNETPENWIESIASYINKPVEINDNFNRVQEIAETHSVDNKTAVIISHSLI